MYENVTNAQVGKLLRTIRFLQGLSQQEIADSIGIHREAVTMMEHGRQVVGVAVFVKWAAALELEPLDVLNGVIDWTKFERWLAAEKATRRV